ncbi:membrane protein of unknown function [Candidatus Saccharimonas aalborgensis]|jgi:hypothetical protein|uniref:Uncharacterized protein n=1 Tax=Candidatus Saccharimonas aalborgensis TaxID=1332188 RepID=R4PUZ4_9BACT|nr:membrane protein of unknown function [Candidatus Saccharimonas aalborgensis]
MRQLVKDSGAQLFVFGLDNLASCRFLFKESKQMSKKLSIKPVHLVVIGLTILVLGILIPSFFIDPSSTIGLSLIMGSIILLSAYTFFAVNVVRSKGKKSIKWLVLPVLLLLLVSGGFFTYNKYQQHLNDKIYSTSDVINFSDFTLSIKEPSFKTVEINVPQDKVSRYGDLGVSEDCSKYPEDNNQPEDYFNEATGKWVFHDEEKWEKDHPTRRYCEWRNDSRTSINKYIANNQRLTLNYELTANSNVDSSKISISLLPDSGRELKTDETHFDYDSLLSDRYVPPFNYAYKPYSQSDLGGDINKGITRQGEIKADVRNDEKNIDLKVTYNGETRLVRVSR